MSKTDLETWHDKLQKDIKISGFRIFPGLPDGEGWRVYWTNDDIESFLNLAKSVQVSLIYSAADSFTASDIDSLLNAEDKLDDEIEDEDEYDDEAENFPPEVIRFKKRAATFLGRLSYVSVAWFHDGIQHIFIKESDWHEELRENAVKLQKIIEGKAEQDSERNNSEIQAKMALVHEKAGELARNPDFATARAGFHGRRIIAERVFPNLDLSLIIRVVSEAETIYQADVLPEKERQLAKQMTLVHERAGELARNSDFADARATAGRKIIAERAFPNLDPSLITDLVDEAWAIYQIDVLPEKERHLAKEARTLLGSGLKETQVAIRLAIRPEKLRKLLTKYHENV